MVSAYPPYHGQLQLIHFEFWNDASRSTLDPILNEMVQLCKYTFSSRLNIFYKHSNKNCAFTYCLFNVLYLWIAWWLMNCIYECILFILICSIQLQKLLVAGYSELELCGKTVWLTIIHNACIYFRFLLNILASILVSYCISAN